ncbi:MAG: 16S rRNA (cytidine(1402)-2'-O)-methyltransferase [Oscillospiraceae bacterium]|nr:16S rRNA (cytidine(1402)-2'-O)-methyltransferase [Oscillospiraceae bacterium]
MAGILYVVGTPIGNLEDMSVRAVRTLQEVDFIAAEDTRVTLKLLNHFDIKKPMVSYHDHNIREKGEVIIAKLLSGENGAIVTDAGMPCISDPGEDLVRLCAQNDIIVQVVPGPSAAISALALSGLNTSKFVFEGFLTTNKSGRMENLEALKNEPRTLIFYEAPHKLKDTLADMRKVLGNRKISLCRELTKIHEEVDRTDLDGAIAEYEERNPKGEYVLIVEGAPEEAGEVSFTLEQAIDMVLSLSAKGTPLSSAAKDVAKQTGFKKGELYKGALDRE